MSAPTLEALETAEARQAAARSRAYRLWADAFGYPDAELVEAVGSGTLVETFRAVLGVVHPPLREFRDWSALTDAGDAADALAVEYTRLFDVGPAGPPCPLYGGLYGGDRMRVMEEVVRFYNHFGLTLAEHPRELPDHLVSELEFLHYLTFREAEALAKDLDPGPWQRGQRDFVERHPGRWVPRLDERLQRQSPPRFYAALVGLLDRFLDLERAHLESVAGRSTADS